MGMSMQILASAGAVLLSLVLAPLLSGIINRVKAIIGGRRGRPLLQLYYDIAKLLRKSPVYSHTSSPFFILAPVAGLGAVAVALLLLPFGALPALFAFPGDFVLLGGLLALSRFTLILAALDTGSAFEGMGAAREGMFSSLTEPLFLFSLLILGIQSGQFSLSGMLGSIEPALWQANWPFYLMLSLAMFLLLLPENCRIPVDDPNTHLELTMIHEVMILDHSGPDLALLEYTAALKLWLFSLIVSGLLFPAIEGRLAGPGGFSGGAGTLAGMLLTLLCIAAVAVLVGLVESLMARVRMERVPQVLTLAGSFICLAALSLWR